MAAQTINERLRQALDLSDEIRQVDIVRRLRVSAPSVCLWFSTGPRRNVPDIGTLSQLARLLQVNLQWLATGEGPMRADRSPPIARCPARGEPAPRPDEDGQILTLIENMDAEQRKALLAFLRTVI